ncbi:MAG: GNAT family N-acetyltransferase [Chloroflexi bacterium]|nr:GNAT family N-acetyltransferase [Chloroflexota bacterium]
MQEGDAEGIAETFAVWHKPREQYEKYFAEQQQDRRVVVLAVSRERVVGYVTVVWDSDYAEFRRQGIPEIVDLNVIDEHQGRGIGRRLIGAAEQIARRRQKTRIGISVEQSPAYVVPNRLYPQLGFVPDGKGTTAEDNGLHLVKVLE